MKHTIEYDGVRRTVEAKRTATIAEVLEIAWPSLTWQKDFTYEKVKCIGTSTVKEAVRLMRLSDDQGTIRHPTGEMIGLTAALRRAGVTAEQAAKAARQLRWASDSAADWSDL